MPWAESREAGVVLRELHPRVTFEDVVLDQTGNRCSARVMLSFADLQLVGSAECEQLQGGRLRCAALATARALEKAAPGQLELTVLAVKLVETVDAVLVIVSLVSRADHVGERLVGSSLVNGRPDRSAVLAVLSATNRLVGPLLA